MQKYLRYLLIAVATVAVLALIIFLVVAQTVVCDPVHVPPICDPVHAPA